MVKVDKGPKQIKSNYATDQKFVHREEIESCLKLHLESLKFKAKPCNKTICSAERKAYYFNHHPNRFNLQTPQRKRFLDKIPKVESISTWSSQGKNSTCNTLLCITLGSRWCLVTWPNVPLWFWLCMAHLESTHWYPVTWKTCSPHLLVIYR